MTPDGRYGDVVAIAARRIGDAFMGRLTMSRRRLGCAMPPHPSSALTRKEMTKIKTCTYVSGHADTFVIKGLSSTLESPIYVS